MPKHDPYLRDRNVSSAAGLQIIAGLGLGAGLGFACAGWFNGPEGLCTVIGAVVGFILANVLVFQYGGRSTR